MKTLSSHKGPKKALLKGRQARIDLTMVYKQQTGKSEAMIITHRAFCGTVRPIKLGNKTLDVVYEIGSLGVIIDSQLSWNSHLERLRKSFGKKVKQLKRFK